MADNQTTATPKSKLRLAIKSFIARIWSALEPQRDSLIELAEDNPAFKQKIIAWLKSRD